MFISMFISMSSWCLFQALNSLLNLRLRKSIPTCPQMQTETIRRFVAWCQRCPTGQKIMRMSDEKTWKNKPREIHNFGPHQIVIFSPREQFPRSVTLPKCSKHNFSKHRFVDENLQVWKPQALWQVSSESWSYQTRLGCCDRWGLWGHRCGTSLAENVWKCMNIGNIWCGKLGSIELEN